MPTAQPENIANQLIDRLSGFELGERPNDIELMLLKREAEKLRTTDIASWWMIQGIFFLYDGKSKEAVESYEKAIALDKHPVFILNYSKTLLYLGMFDESYNVLAKYSQDDAAILKKAYQRATVTGRITAALKHLSDLLPMYPDLSEESKNLSKIDSTRQELNISEHDFQAAHSLMLSALYESNELPKEVSYQLDPADSSQLIILFYVDTSSDVMADSSWRFAEMLEDNTVDAIMNNKLITILKAAA